jgi:CheY-like chemotaxis protein/MinD-like ATPase involved in chromosome partitioning or flagellar assembly
MAGSNILVIDGDLASRNFLAQALNKEGHHILQAASGKEGLIFAWRDRPDIIIVDPVITDITAEQLAARLRSDARTAKVPLIALSSDSRPGRARSCKEAGFNEYLVKTAQAIPSLIESVNRLLGRSKGFTKEGGYLIVFMSAKGGTGTSSLCANIAMNISASQPEASVVVVDMVLPIGSIAGIVGYESDENLVTISGLPAMETTPEFFRKTLKEVENWRFHLLAGSPDPERSNELVIGRIEEIVATLKSTFDFVLLDFGRSLSRISLPLIEHADLIAMIVGSDLSTVNLTKTVWDYLQARDVEADAIYIFFNRSIGLEGLTKPEAEKIIGIPVKSVLPFLGGNFAMANDQHQPYTVKFPKDTASIVLRDVAKQMVGLVKSLRAR